MTVSLPSILKEAPETAVALTPTRRTEKGLAASALMEMEEPFFTIAADNAIAASMPETTTEVSLPSCNA